jgi:hypothetical protein
MANKLSMAEDWYPLAQVETQEQRPRKFKCNKAYLRKAQWWTVWKTISFDM